MSLRPNSPLASLAPSWAYAPTFLGRRSAKNDGLASEQEDPYFPVGKLGFASLRLPVPSCSPSTVPVGCATPHLALRAHRGARPSKPSFSQEFPPVSSPKRSFIKKRGLKSGYNHLKTTTHKMPKTTTPPITNWPRLEPKSFIGRNRKAKINIAVRRAIMSFALIIIIPMSMMAKDI